MSNWVDVHLDVLAASPVEINNFEQHTLSMPKNRHGSAN